MLDIIALLLKKNNQNKKYAVAVIVSLKPIVGLKWSFELASLQKP